MTIQDIKDYIDRAEPWEVDLLCDYIMDRKERAHPDWDFLYLALPRQDPAVRRTALNALRAFLDEQSCR